MKYEHYVKNDPSYICCFDSFGYIFPQPRTLLPQHLIDGIRGRDGYAGAAATQCLHQHIGSFLFEHVIPFTVLCRFSERGKGKNVPYHIFVRFGLSQSMHLG